MSIHSEPVGYAFLAPVDRFLELHRILVVVIIILVVVLASPLLFWLQFDFNPLHLQSPKVESVATFLELRKNPQTGANAIEIKAPDLAAANATARRLSALPEVSQTRTLSDLVPSDQDEKLKLIHDAGRTIDASLNPRKVDRPPTDQENIEALSSVADTLSKVAGVVTLELCVVFDLPLNFANIIALPLLLGVGVAFKIYYIMAWRAGKTALLQSSLTRAVIFSAMTTATAFGSLWLSSQPGTSSMGKLMALALVCTMTAAVLFQPALMGPPREKG